MNLLKPLCLGLLTLWSFSLFSQEITFEWAHAFGGPQSDPPSDVGVDSEGNLYFVGGFSGTADFDPSINNYNLTAAGSLDIFIAKYSSEGTLLWAKSLGSGGSDTADNIIIGSNDEIYISGTFDGMVDFDPNGGVSALSSNGWQDCFLMRISNEGDLLWARSFGASELDLVQGLHLDQNGNVLIAGYFNGEVNFNPNAAPIIYNAVGDNDVFVCKYDANGNLLWAKQLSGSGSAFAKGITCDSNNNIYFAGYFTLEMDCDPNSGEQIINSNGLNDAYMIKLNENGEFVWSKSFGAWSEDRIFAIEIATNDRLYVGGYYRGDVDFDPNEGEILIPSTNGSEDYFIQQFDLDGNLIWAQGFGGSQSEFLQSLAVDATNNVYICGSAASIYDADPSENENLISNTAPFAKNIIIHKINALGEHVWAYGFGSNEEDFGRGIFVAPNRDVYVSGQFRSVADLNPLDGTASFTSNAFHDVFVLKLSQCSPLSAVQDVSTCEDSYTWINGLSYSSNQEGLEFLNVGVAEGQCDSLYTLNLTFIEVDNSISTGENSISANQEGASYQWYNCGSDMLPLEGATEQSFSPSETGSYLVEISVDGCTSSSECVFITVVSSGEELTQTARWEIYPNPSQGNFIIAFQGQNLAEDLLIFDALGRPISFDVMPLSDQLLGIYLHQASSGVYFLKVKSAGIWKMERILVE